MLAWAVCTPAALGEILPSFRLDTCGWHATHVVVVTEGGKIDGAVQVLESWKGDLRKGDRLTLPELASIERAISPGWARRVDPTLPPHVTGSRMVLFLKRRPLKRDPSKGSWTPADYTKEMRVSVAWIEQGRVYAYVQEINPGPSRLVSLRMTEEALREELLRLVKTQDGLTRALALPDPGKRAEALRPFVRSDLIYAQIATFEALGKCGKGGLPVLRELLRDDSLARQHAAVVRALTEAGGTAAGPDLTALLERELAFWKKTGPKLPAGWWNNRGGLVGWEEAARLSDRYCLAREALRGLREVRFAASRKVVAEFRDFWRSLPQLEDKSGLNEMSKECDRLLDALKK